MPSQLAEAEKEESRIKMMRAKSHQEHAPITNENMKDRVQSSVRNSYYYERGSEEAAIETALTINRLEQRRVLTRNCKRLVIVLVGLPGRGKSFVARKLQYFLTWLGLDCKIFNVGKYRREAAAQLAFETAKSGTKSERDVAGSCDANFFDPNNTKAAQLRERVAEVALRDMLEWLDDEEDNKGSLFRDNSGLTSASDEVGQSRDRIAIFDATNSTVKRRQWILEECTSPEKRKDKPTGVVFVESICDDEDLLEENFRFKVVNSPDFEGMSEEEAVADLRQRVKKYEDQYETIDDDSLSYIKVFNLSTKVLVNHCYGRMSKIIVPAIMAWNIGSRPIFLCRPGKTHSSVQTDEDDYVAYVNEADPALEDMSVHTRKKSMKGDMLGMDGLAFSLKLRDFIQRESEEFLARRTDISASRDTGTSLTGITPWDRPFPTTVLTSTMPRAVQTCQWAREHDLLEQFSNLNPLDKGDFMGLELDQIQDIDPDWYACLEEDPFHTRFPGGESYSDLIHRLESIIIDVEQQVSPVLIVSHVSVLQLLIAYCRNSPVEKAMSIEVPMHTVLKFTPSRGGGWTETRHCLLEEDVSPLAPVVSGSDLSYLSLETPTTPIWNDPIERKKPVLPKEV